MYSPHFILAQYSSQIFIHRIMMTPLEVQGGGAKFALFFFSLKKIVQILAPQSVYLWYRYLVYNSLPDVKIYIKIIKHSFCFIFQLQFFKFLLLKFLDILRTFVQCYTVFLWNFSSTTSLEFTKLALFRRHYSILQQVLICFCTVLCYFFFLCS